MKTQYSCIIMEGQVIDCDDCISKRECTVYALLCDLTAIRLHCPNCYRETKEEHVRYCPFCGYHILDVPISNEQVKPVLKNTLSS